MAFVLSLQNHGIRPHDQSLQDIAACSERALATLRAQTGIQSKASRLPPLVPTFKTHIKIAGLRIHLPALSLRKNLKQDLHLRARSGQLTLPKGAHLVSEQLLRASTSLEAGVAYVVEAKSLEADSKEKERQSVQVPSEAAGPSNPPSENLEEHLVVQSWGAPWTEAEFVAEAVKAGHPQSFKSALPSALRDAIDRFGKTSVASRSSLVSKPFGDGCQGPMTCQRRRRTFTPACALGEAPVTGLWPAKMTPASATSADLKASAARERSTCCSRSSDPQMDGPVWEATMKEVGLGYLDGPFELSDIPADWPLSPRFGIVQGSKLRRIDDFSRSGVNACAQTLESPRPHTLDVIAGLCKSVMGSRSQQGAWSCSTFDLKRMCCPPFIS